MDTRYDTVGLTSAASTQDEARARFAGSPVLVVAGRQTAGRGRSGRHWEQAARAVHASLAFAPGWAPADLPLVSLIAALAARDALDDPPDLKWPNDLIRDGAKVGGILVEALGGPEGTILVAGLGLNLFWPDPAPGAGARYAADPGPEAALPIARRWADAVMERVGRGARRWGRAEYTAACRTLGEEVVWEPGGAGRAVDVAEDGTLVVSTPAGLRRLAAGEVRHVRPASLGARPSTERPE